MGLVEIKPIDRIRVVEREPGKLERHAVQAFVPLRLPIVPFEFIVAHPILVCRTTSKAQGRAGADSPAFNYTFARHDDVLKFGFTVAFSPPPPAAAPTYPVKALRLK